MLPPIDHCSSAGGVFPDDLAAWQGLKHLCVLWFRRIDKLKKIRMFLSLPLLHLKAFQLVSCLLPCFLPFQTSLLASVLLWQIYKRELCSGHRSFSITQWARTPSIPDSDPDKPVDSIYWSAKVQENLVAPLSQGMPSFWKVDTICCPSGKMKDWGFSWKFRSRLEESPIQIVRGKHADHLDITSPSRNVLKPVWSLRPTQ